MAYYAPPPRPDRGSFSYHYPQDTGYGYATSPNPPYPTNSSYYPPSSAKPRTTPPAANYSYYPPPSPSSAYPVNPTTAPAAPTAKPRRRSVSFSTPVVVVEPTPSSSEKKKETLYRHITPATSAAPKSPKSPSSTTPRRFSKIYDDLDYEYLRKSYKEDKSHPQVFDDDSQDDDVFYEYNKEKLSRRFDRSKTGGGLGLRRSGTVTEKISTSSSSSKSPKHAYAEVKMPSLHIPRAPRPPAPQRTTPPPPPPAPASNRSGGSDRSRRSDRATHGGTTVRGDYDYDYDYDYEYDYVSSDRLGPHAGRKNHVIEEKKEKSWMNINGNKIVVDHKGVKINGQRYDAPGGKGTFNVGGIKIRVDGGVISLV